MRERREHRIAATRLGAQSGRIEQHRRAMPGERHAVSLERRGNCAIQSARPGQRRAAGVHRRRAHRARQAWNFLDRGAAPQDQRCTTPRQIVREGRQTVVQPPPAGPARRPSAGGHLIQHIDRQDRLPARHGRAEGSVVRQPKVVAKPDQARAGWLCGARHRLPLAGPEDCGSPAAGACR